MWHPMCMSRLHHISLLLFRKEEKAPQLELRTCSFLSCCVPDTILAQKPSEALLKPLHPVKTAAWQRCTSFQTAQFAFVPAIALCIFISKFIAPMSCFACHPIAAAWQTFIGRETCDQLCHPCLCNISLLNLDSFAMLLCNSEGYSSASCSVNDKL